MTDGPSFSGREIAAVVSFTVLAAVIGVTSYRAGLNLSGNAGGAQMQAASGPAPVNGQALFASNCAGCHGGQAQGGVGPALLDAKTWTTAAFNDSVLHGKHPSGRELAPVMPRFAQTGLDGAPPAPEQIEAIHAFVKGL
ncbi:c-type cytochrome [Deinococcus navajonensis]|uniref:C-type cytochrome n=1 Tax=Deinococcus navajonensis TaxID=309884 RepID=A0ABV8XNQ4_9DEIO